MNTTSVSREHTHLPAEERATDATTLLGFWIYLMTDLVLFASLLAVFEVLRGNSVGMMVLAGGPSGSELFDLSFILKETLVLLVSSFTCGMALLAARAGSKHYVLCFLAVTALLGVAFVTMEYSEFSRLVLDGNGWTKSGFLSSYFTLVGTHGLHIVAGLLWMIVSMGAIIRQGLSHSNMRKLLLLSLFWHFLDMVWIFIFTVVYLMAFV